MKNILFILADQLRADSLGYSGNAIVRTPHIDKLAADGFRFTQAFAQHPQCVPSRSSLATGRYPHVNGSTSNHVAMNAAEQTLPAYLRRQGYYTAAIGKTHLYQQQEHESYAFTMLSGGQTSNRTTPELLRDDYANWLHANGHWDAVVHHYANRAKPNYRENFQAVISPLPPEAYYDVWVADRAVEFLQTQAHPKQPFFLFIGFPNPHNPFEPPEPYASYYDPTNMPIPDSFHSDLRTKPPQHLAYKRNGRANLGLNFEDLTAEKLQRVIAHYYASVTLVDDQVGKLLHALVQVGLQDDTVIVFTSDHGELLGQHGMLLKSTDAYPMLYDVLLRVPLIIRLPGRQAGAYDELVELVDIAPTLLNAVDLSAVPQMQGRSLLPAMQGESHHPRTTVFAESGAVKMLRGERYKLVYYPGQPYGELYDLQGDPHEMHNLYSDAAYANIRQEMQTALLDRLIATEAPLHGESIKGAAYWRTHYRLPFQHSNNAEVQA